MPTGTESICCHEILRVRIESGNLPCITLHDGFEAICLNAHVIESSIYQYIDEEGGYVDDRATFE